MVNPCCCMSLQRGVSVLAIIDAILNAIAIVVSALALAAVIVVDPDEHSNITQSEKTQAIVLVVLMILASIFYFVLALYLRKGAKTRDKRICYVWLIIATILVIFSLINIGLQFHAHSRATELGSGVFGILYKLYQIWVVISFRNEIMRNENNINFSDP